MKNEVRKKDIAIVGISGKFPRSKNIHELWENLCKGEELLHIYTDDELRGIGIPEHSIGSSNYIKHHGVIDEPGNFDHAFFGYTEHEAAAMDPQMRHLHEFTWLALNDAGYDPFQYNGKIGLYLAGSDNINWRVSRNILKDTNINPFYLGQISDINFVSTMISYNLNLRGPSYFLNTACSSSLVSIHIACRSLLMKECNMAISGGVSITSSIERGYHYEPGSIYSKDGHCKTFDKDSSGTVDGEGVGIVVLKRLNEAIEDGDHIYAVIRSSATNNDGNNKVGYTAPSIQGQSDCIKMAQQLAGVAPDQISYVEAHGTATKLGDPIEIAALNKAFQYNTQHTCAIGSIKSNLGHLDAAAGVAGLIKTSLMLKNKQIPASLHFNSPNPEIDFDSGPFYVNTELKKWRSGDNSPLLAGVSSFGVGGTNAHAILEEAPVLKSKPSHRKYKILTMSAKTPQALDRNILNLKQYLELSNDDFSDVAYTLNTGRSPFHYRKMFVCSEIDQLIQEIESSGASKYDSAQTETVQNKVVFMFPGQGAQYGQMCQELYQSEPAFRKELDKCFQILKRISGKDLSLILFSKEEKEIHLTENTQPILFAVEYSLAKLLNSWGLYADMMIGHSLGEYVAACLSGVLTLEDTIDIVYRRAQLMNTMPKGAMLSIYISENQLIPYLNENKDVSLAAINSISSCVVSGSEESVLNFKDKMEIEGFTSKIIPTSHAFHSCMMDDMLLEYQQALSKLTFSEQRVPFISNLTGKLAVDSVISKPEYWVDHLRNTVRFSEGIAEIMRQENVVFVEVGPGKALTSFVGANDKKRKGHKAISLLGHKNARGSDAYNVLSAMGKLWLNGIVPDWMKYYGDENRRRVSLPGYSFEKNNHGERANVPKLISELSLTQTEMSDWFYFQNWQVSEPTNNLNKTSEPFVNLFFLDENGIGNALSSEFENVGEKVIGIKEGVSFSKTNESEFVIDPCSEEDYSKLFEFIAIESNIRIIFLWGINQESNSLTKADVKRELDVGYYSLLNISKSASTRFRGSKVEIVSLSNNMHHILKNDSISPEKSPLLGALRVIPKEYDEFRCRNIDIRLNDSNEYLISCLYDEIISETEDNEVAYRNGDRFVPTLNAKRIDQPSTTTFVSNGVYLITGGLGGIGLTISKNISKSIKGVNLILTGRKNLPTDIAWKHWLSEHDKDDPLYNIILNLSQIEELGAKVFYINVDISDYKALDDSITEIQKKAGKINGVIHSAGLADYSGVIHRRSKKDSEELFAAKIYGTIALSEILSGNKLDFFVSHSSLASILAPFGQVGYVASNLFLEAFSKYQSINNSFKALSIGWNEWREVGMASSANQMNNASLDSISPEEGYELLLRSLNSNSPVLFISKTGTEYYKNDSEILERVEEDENWFERIEFGSNDSNEDIKDSLTELWRSFFSNSAIDDSTDFFEAGGDSLKATTLIHRMKKIYNVEISLNDFYTKPTIRDLAQEIYLALKVKNLQSAKKSTNQIRI